MSMSNQGQALNHESAQQESNGFIAGTLVHTDQGLVPIEQIKVGDRVLSKNEDGEGDLDYKRVSQTFKSTENQALYAIWYEVRHNPLERLLVCSKYQPFWINDKGSWVEGCVIDASFKHGYGAPIIFSDGQKGEVVFALPILATLEKDICYLWDQNWYRRVGSMMFDFRQSPILLSSTFTDLNLYPTDQFALATLEERDFYSDKVDDTLDWINTDDNRTKPSLRYEATVYHLEVEGFHTYYVGDAGVWVHDQNRCADGVKLIEAIRH